MKPGSIEYVLTACQEPVLFVIKRQQRLAPDRTRQEAFYYVLHGSVYQAPCLHTCLTSRMKRCLYSLESGFAQLRHDLEPLEWKERQRVKRASKAQKLVDGSKSGARAQADTGAEDAGAAADTHAVAQSDRSNDAHQHILPQAPPSAAHMQWLRQTDQVLLSVLSRCAVITFYGLVMACAPAVGSFRPHASCMGV